MKMKMKIKALVAVFAFVVLAGGGYYYLNGAQFSADEIKGQVANKSAASTGNIISNLKADLSSKKLVVNFDLSDRNAKVTVTAVNVSDDNSSITLSESRPGEYSAKLTTSRIRPHGTMTIVSAKPNTVSVTVTAVSGGKTDTQTITKSISVKERR